MAPVAATAATARDLTETILTFSVVDERKCMKSLGSVRVEEEEKNMSRECGLHI